MQSIARFQCQQIIVGYTHDRGAATITSNSLALHHHSVHGDPPVALLVHRDVGHLTLVPGRVGSPQEDLPTHRRLWVPRQPEGEYGINQALIL